MALRFAKPRLLPLLIIVASAALVLRLGMIHDSVANALPASSEGDESFAGDSSAAAEILIELAGGKAETPSAPAGDEAGEDASEPERGSEVEDDESAESKDPAGQIAHAASKPATPTFSASEVAVLQQLVGRRSELDAWEKKIGERAALLQAAEARIDQKVKEFQDIRATLEDVVRSYEELEGAKIRSLVKIYENMKPREAARIFEELEIETLLLVADRMKERKLAPIMANMNPGKAKDVTVQLAQQRQLPESLRLSGRCVD